MIPNLMAAVGAGAMQGFRAPLFTALIAVMVTYLLTPYVRSVAIHQGAVDDPAADDRRVHLKPIPRWGGLAIYGGIVVALGVVMPFAYMEIIFSSNSESMVSYFWTTLGS